jgi:hypothetical protein
MGDGEGYSKVRRNGSRFAASNRGDSQGLLAVALSRTTKEPRSNPLQVCISLSARATAVVAIEGDRGKKRMAGFIEQRFAIKRPLAWLDQLEVLFARELAPSPRKIRTALRLSTIVTIAIGLDASCHVNSQLGAVIVWLLAGAGPMMSIRKALAWQIAVMLALITSVVMARAFAETPWLMLPFVFVWIFIFNPRGNDAQARRGPARYTDSLPHYILRRRICTSGNRFERSSLVRR